MKHLIALLAALAMQFLTGCFQTSIVVHVKPDGSGTVQQTLTMTDATIEQLKAMAGADAGKQKGPHEIDEAKLKAQAAKMGDGVTFVSAKPIKAGGRQGFTATFAFEDIEDLKVTQTPDMGGGGGDAAKSDVTFEFEEGDNAPSTLTIHIPQNKQEAAPAGSGPDGDEALAMMQQILKDMHVTFTVEVQGAIQKTNASHRDGAKVTLLDLEFSKVLADPVKLKALSKTKDPTTDEAKALLKTIPGMKVETENPLTVQFK